MAIDGKNIVTKDPWGDLGAITPARIGLGRCGSSVPHKAYLSFKMDHAQARDAVNETFRDSELMERIEALGFSTLLLKSSVLNRREFLARPDKGRVLSPESRRVLEDHGGSFDICYVISDGLSARAVHENSPDFIEHHLALLNGTGFSIAPVCIINNGRVAVADEIGDFFSAKITVILLGERPGLSSPNSMGIYMTHMAKPGCTDEARNCISNVRKGGLSIFEASVKLAYLIENALKIKKSGIHLKDRMDVNYLPFGKDFKTIT